MTTTGVSVGQDLSRFWDKVDKSGTCLAWKGCTVRGGYGHFSILGKMKYAHRVAYELTVQAIPEGLEIDHACFNRACVNPAHLRTTTRKQNLENLKARGGSASGIRGVYWSKRDKKWEAQMTHNGVIHWLGYFQTASEAERVVVAKRLELYTHNDLDKVMAENLAERNEV